MRIRVTEDPQYDLIHKVGSIDLEYGVHGRELELELRKAQEQFVRAMELRGLTLVRHAGLRNPVWVCNEDETPMAVYAIDWEGTRPRKERRAGGEVVLPTTRETSLEESRGRVEYRIVGLFWGPKTTLEVLRDKQLIKDQEKGKRAPIRYGPGGRNEFKVGEGGRESEPAL